MIANCSHTETNRYIGGQPGDQTGSEYAVVPYYSRPWSCVLRYPDKGVAADISMLARAAAENDRIGYDQTTRLTFYQQLKSVNWEPQKITIPCNADCSSSTAALLIAVGYRNSIIKLRDLSPAMTTKSMRNALTKAGFSALSDGVYTKSDKFLLPGDILLLEGHHVAINLDKGIGDEALKQTTSEVVDGLWGNGTARKEALTAAGWNYTEIQASVNLALWR